MTGKVTWMRVVVGLGVLLSSASAQTESVLYSFKGAPDGAYPVGSLVADNRGNLYGATANGGYTPSSQVYGCGTVFELKRTTAGFSESVIWTFQSTSAKDGCSPFNVIIDAAGNLYGTTSWGGAYSSGCPTGCGTAFELSPTEAAVGRRRCSGISATGRMDSYPSRD